MMRNAVNWLCVTVALWTSASTIAQPSPDPASSKILAGLARTDEDLANMSNERLVALLIDEADRARYDGRVVQEIADRGITASLHALSALGDNQPHRRAMVYDAIALASRSRGWHPELLRRYDPAAYRVFWEPEGVGEQRKLAACLPWDKWERACPEALVRAAPVPTLDWLKEQAVSDKPRIDKVVLIIQSWSTWERQGRETRHSDDVRQVIVSLLRNAAIRAAPSAAATLVRAAGDCRSTESTPIIAALLLESPEVAVRSESAAALGKLGGDAARDALIKCLATEDQRVILTRAAGSLENWPTDESVGDELKTLYEKNSEPAVRRAILFSAMKGRWKARSAMIEKALKDDDGGVVGTGLQAFAADPIPEGRETVLTIARSTRHVQAPIADAVAALKDSSVSPVLSVWLARELNPSIIVKIIVALRANSDEQAREALRAVVTKSDQPMAVEQAILALDALGDEPAIPALTKLASDRAAPVGVRMQAVLALGRFDKPETRQAIEQLRVGLPEAFGEPTGDAGVSLASLDRLEMARLYVTMARARLGEKAAVDEITDIFNAGNATTRYYAVFLLGSLKIDHPVIGRSLRSNDFSLLVAGLRAATRIDAAKYRAEFESIESAPFLRAIRESGIDSLNFRDLLREALRDATAPKPAPASATQVSEQTGGTK